jgi:hypothetical protein
MAATGTGQRVGIDGGASFATPTRVRWTLLALAIGCGNAPQKCDGAWGDSESLVCPIQAGSNFPTGSCDGSIPSCSDCGEYPTRCYCSSGTWYCVPDTSWMQDMSMTVDFARPKDLGTID